MAGQCDDCGETNRCQQCDACLECGMDSPCYESEIVCTDCCGHDHSHDDDDEEREP